jgi:hypothetical protein
VVCRQDDVQDVPVIAGSTGRGGVCRGGGGGVGGDAAEFDAGGGGDLAAE